MKKYLLLIILSFFLTLNACNKEEEQTPYIPENIRLEDNKVLFDIKGNYDTFEILVNDKLFETTNNSYELDEEGSYEIKIRTILNDKHTPYSKYVRFNYKKTFNSAYSIIDKREYDENSDAIFYIETNGGTITQINGNEIAINDFKIEDNRITIKKEYINKQFEGSRNSLILSYVVKGDDTNYIGNVTISK